MSLPLHRRLALHAILEPRRARAAQHDVEPVGEAVERHAGVAVERRDQLSNRRFRRNGFDDRALRDQRIGLEIHLRDQTLHPSRAGYRVMDMRWTPVVDAVAPRIGTGLYRPVDVMAVAIGQRASAAAEVGVDWCDVVIVAMPIAATRVRLPHFDERIGNAAAKFVEHVAVDDDALTYRQAALRII